jgi:hypothetical protein
MLLITERIMKRNANDGGRHRMHAVLIYPQLLQIDR